jgi:hypothetical protein
VRLISRGNKVHLVDSREYEKNFDHRLVEKRNHPYGQKGVAARRGQARPRFLNSDILNLVISS